MCNSNFEKKYGISIEDGKGISNMETSGITDMSDMFTDCWASGISNLDFSRWDVSKVTNMNSMFARTCIDHEHNISEWDVRNVTDMTGMFLECHMEDLDLSNWRLDSLQHIDFMFNKVEDILDILKDWGWLDQRPDLDWEKVCVYSKKDIDLSKFDTSRMRDLSWLLYHYDIGRTPRNLNTWDVSNVTDMATMFYSVEYWCYDISDWDVSHVVSMSGMFRGTYNLDIDLSNWNLKSLENVLIMFSGTKITMSHLEKWGWLKQRPDLDWDSAV